MNDALTRINALHALGRTADAQRIIVNAMKLAGGSKRDAAAKLGCSPVTLYRLISQLDMWSTLDDLAAVQGWRHRAGAARNIVSALALCCVVGITLTACAADGATLDDERDPAPYSADVAGAPAPSDADAAVNQKITSPESDAAVAGAPAPVEQPAPAGAPAPVVVVVEQPAPVAGTSAPAPTPAGAAAPVPVAAVTTCKLTTGQRVDCSPESRRIWVNTLLMWTNNSASTFNCGAPDAPACVTGTACSQHNTSTHTTTDGVCL